MNNRFENVFKAFQQTFAEEVQSLKKMSVVFCMKINDDNTSTFEVYRDFVFDESNFNTAGVINPMLALFNDSIWFAFDHHSGSPDELEAYVNYLDDHRPKFCIGQEKPLFTKRINSVPFISGITKSAQYSNNNLKSHSQQQKELFQ